MREVRRLLVPLHVLFSSSKCSENILEYGPASTCTYHALFDPGFLASRTMVAFKAAHRPEAPICAASSTNFDAGLNFSLP
jgi:hypothetical protein